MEPKIVNTLASPSVNAQTVMTIQHFEVCFVTPVSLVVVVVRSFLFFFATVSFLVLQLMSFSLLFVGICKVLSLSSVIYKIEYMHHILQPSLLYTQCECIKTRQNPKGSSFSCKGKGHILCTWGSRLAKTSFSKRNVFLRTVPCANVASNK